MTYDEYRQQALDIYTNYTHGNMRDTVSDIVTDHVRKQSNRLLSQVAYVNFKRTIDEIIPMIRKHSNANPPSEQLGQNATTKFIIDKSDPLYSHIKHYNCRLNKINYIQFHFNRWSSYDLLF